MVLETIYLITWMVACPLDHEFDMWIKQQTTSYREDWNDGLYVECPKHHIVLVARPEKIVKKWKTVKSSNEARHYVETEDHEEELVRPT